MGRGADGRASRGGWRSIRRCEATTGTCSTTGRRSAGGWPTPSGRRAPTSTSIPTSAPGCGGSGSPRGEARRSGTTRPAASPSAFGAGATTSAASRRTSPSSSWGTGIGVDDDADECGFLPSRSAIRSWLRAPNLSPDARPVRHRGPFRRAPRGSSGAGARGSAAVRCEPSGSGCSGSTPTTSAISIAACTTTPAPSSSRSAGGVTPRAGHGGWGSEGPWPGASPTTATGSPRPGRAISIPSTSAARSRQRRARALGARLGPRASGIYAGAAGGDHDAAKQRQIYLQGADPLAVLGNPFLRSRGALLVGDDFRYHAAGRRGSPRCRPAGLDRRPSSALERRARADRAPAARWRLFSRVASRPSPMGRGRSAARRSRSPARGCG